MVHRLVTKIGEELGDSVCSGIAHYRSKEVIRAAKIAAVEIHKDMSATIALAGSASRVIRTDPGWGDFFKGDENDPGYYVVQSGGIPSWLPSAVIEGGYEEFNENSSPLSELTRSLQSDEDYAWSWMCNLACIGLDSGGDHEAANNRAADFMQSTFGVDVRATTEWKFMEARWEKAGDVQEEDLSFSAQCDTLLAKLQIVLNSNSKRTIEEMYGVASRMADMGHVIANMELFQAEE